MEKEEIIIKETKKNSKTIGYDEDSERNQVFKVFAKFYMNNTSSKAKTVPIGFPKEHEYLLYHSGFNSEIYDFKVKYADRIIKNVKKYNGEFGFGWEMTLKSGLNVIELSYNVISNNGYDNAFQNIYYIIQTGKFWKDPIGSVKIDLIFLEGLNERILKVNPKNYSIDGNKISWEMKNVEPEKWNNVEVRFLSYYDYLELKKLNNINEKYISENEKLLIALRLFSLAYNRGKKLYFSENVKELDKKMVEKNIFPFLKTNERDLFFKYFIEIEEKYVLKKEFQYKESNDLNKELRTLFSGTDINFDIEGDYFINKGLSILKEVIDKNPKNELAWSIYLLNLNKIHVLDNYIEIRRKEIIDEANKYIKHSKTIKYWTALIYPKKRKLPFNLGQYNTSIYEDRIKEHMTFYAPGSNKGIQYAGGSYTKEELALVRKCYYRKQIGVSAASSGDKEWIIKEWDLYRKLFTGKNDREEMINFIGDQYYNEYYTHKIRKHLFKKYKKLLSDINEI